VTISFFEGQADATAPLPAVQPDTPRRIARGLSTSDRIFQWGTRSVGFFVLLLTGAIGLMLGYMIIPTIRRYGFHFLTSTDDLSIARGEFAMVPAILGTIQIAVVALVIAFPLALAAAIYISEYAPAWLKGTAIAAIDLMAAIPSIIYGVWGLFLLAPRAIYLSRWLHQNVGWLPLFHVNTDPNAAAWAQYEYTGSALIAAICVAMMVIPIACSIMRGVFAQAPIGEREAAYALGATRWGMIRTVVLPFGRSGIIGGTMLGLGRALGETIAVSLIIQQSFDIKWSLTQGGTGTISYLIANNFGQVDSTQQLEALLAAGFVLFVMTLFVNTVAGVLVARSRSGAGTDA
jgi:phosphate transport system permease protein